MQILLLILLDLIVRQKYESPQKNDLGGFSAALKISKADCNDLINGIWLALDASNSPGSGWWMIVSCGDPSTRKQIAYDLSNEFPAKTRNFSAGYASGWTDLIIPTKE